MKKLVLLALLLLLPVAAAAQDMHLVCDPADPGQDIVQTQVTMDGVEQPAMPYEEFVASDGGTYCDLMNLSGIGNGQHTATAVFINSWGEVSPPSSPLSFSKPAAPMAPEIIELRRR